MHDDQQNREWFNVHVDKQHGKGYNVVDKKHGKGCNVQNIKQLGYQCYLLDKGSLWVAVWFKLFHKEIIQMLDNEI